MVKKKKLLFHTDFSLSKTGFGRNAKSVLSYLYKTGKYEIVTLCGGITKAHPELERTPWKSLGTVPNLGPEVADCNSSPDKQRMYAYGAFEIEKVIQQEKPDVYIGVQDFWGLEYSLNKYWFDKISSAIWTTLDSLPLLTNAVVNANKIKNYWVWSSFAEKEMHRLGHKHVKTIHGAVDASDFKPLSDQERLNLRKQNNIDPKDFVIGFVFRNQLRKSVPNLLQGFKLFKDANPGLSPKLLLHTHWQEGWNIIKLAEEAKVDQKDILTTYICKSCRGYEVKPFTGAQISCPVCNLNDSRVTTNTAFGTTEKQLNDIYNLMDVYCHPFTSGGQEIPIQEAKLAGLITLVTNYSCGEEMCEPEASSIPLQWTEYREFGTEFIKASTCPNSIKDKLQLVLNMSPDDRARMGRKARKWVINNFSTEVVGSQIEKFLDSCPFADPSIFENKESQKNPNAIIENIEDPALWVKHLYLKILNIHVSDNDSGLIHWVERLKSGAPREAIVNFFRETATKENGPAKIFSVLDLFVGIPKEDRLLLSIKSSKENLFLSTKIISGIKKKYPNKKIFVFSTPECSDIFTGNPHIQAAIYQSSELENPSFLAEHFSECFCLDEFSIKNNHSIFIK
jgi:glycosyltransferase involved in cell wall biosynthesis